MISLYRGIYDTTSFLSMETLTVLFLIVFAFVDPPVGKVPPNQKSFAETSYKVLRRDCLTQPFSFQSSISFPILVPSLAQQASKFWMILNGSRRHP